MPSFSPKVVKAHGFRPPIKKNLISEEKKKKTDPPTHGIGATIRIGQEI